MLDRYVAQVRLLLSVLPDIATETVFALKGGTAINLFYRDMPRLSVDVDLTYLPVADRQSSLEDMDDAFNRIATAITERNPRVKARRIAGGGDNDTRIMVSDGSAQIKIETSPVTRGAVYPARTMVASETVMEQFGFVETNVLAFEDLYGSKLHAALDRQHPRDLVDVKFRLGPTRCCAASVSTPTRRARCPAPRTWSSPTMRRSTADSSRRSCPRRACRPERARSLGREAT